MIRHFLLPVLFLFLIFPAGAFAAVAGAELLQKCQPIEKLDSAPESLSSREASGVVYCLGYVDSFMETFYFQVQAKIVPALPYCLPSEDLPKKDIVKSVVDYLQSNSEDLTKPAGYYIFMALREAYPCNKEEAAEKIPEDRIPGKQKPE